MSGADHGYGAARFALWAPILLIAGAFFQTSQIGVGAFPEEIGFRNVRRGATAQQTLGVINDSDRPRVLEVVVTGEAGDWLTVIGEDDAEPSGVVLPGDRRFLTVSVTVPDDVPNGEYRAALELISRRSDDDDGQSTIGLTVEVPVSVLVTGTQIVAGSVDSVTAEDTEEGLPMRFLATIDNRSNVIIVPELTVEVLRDGVVVDTFGLDAGVVPLGTHEISGEWPTDQRPGGPYGVRVSAAFAGEDLGSASTRFTLYERGHFTRRVAVLDHRLANQPAPGGVAEVELDVLNTGEIEATVTFVAELTLDGRRVEEAKSRPVVVGRGREARLRVFFSVEEGVYLISGRAAFEGGNTPVENLVFRVGRPEGSPAAWVLAGIGVAAVLALLVVTVARLARWRQERRMPPIPDHPRVG